MIDQKRLEKCLGSREFYSCKEVVKIGLFGSKSAFNRCVRSGKIPTIQVTESRRVVMRQDLIEFLLKEKGA